MGIRKQKKINCTFKLLTVQKNKVFCTNQKIKYMTLNVYFPAATRNFFKSQAVIHCLHWPYILFYSIQPVRLDFVIRKSYTNGDSNPTKGCTFLSCQRRPGLFVQLCNLYSLFDRALRKIDDDQRTTSSRKSQPGNIFTAATSM